MSRFLVSMAVAAMAGGGWIVLGGVRAGMLDGEVHDEILMGLFLAALGLFTGSYELYRWVVG